jgi:hypothetical protein
MIVFKLYSTFIVVKDSPVKYFAQSSTIMGVCFCIMPSPAPLWESGFFHPWFGVWGLDPVVFCPVQHHYGSLASFIPGLGFAIGVWCLGFGLYHWGNWGVLPPMVSHDTMHDTTNSTILPHVTQISRYLDKRYLEIP